MSKLAVVRWDGGQCVVMTGVQQKTGAWADSADTLHNTQTTMNYFKPLFFIL